eukprot:2510146-Prymnesium_polylepis.1
MTRVFSGELLSEGCGLGSRGGKRELTMNKDSGQPVGAPRQFGNLVAKHVDESSDSGLSAATTTDQ